MKPLERKNGLDGPLSYFDYTQVGQILLLTRQAIAGVRRLGRFAEFAEYIGGTIELDRMRNEAS